MTYRSHGCKRLDAANDNQRKGLDRPMLGFWVSLIVIYGYILYVAWSMLTAPVVYPA